MTVVVRLIGIQPPASYDSPQDWLRWGPREYIAFDGTDPIGFLAWDPVGPEGEDVVSIRKIHVDPARRRQGVADRLMDELVGDHPTGEIYMGSFLTDGHAWFTSWLRRRPAQQPGRFTRHLDDRMAV